MQLKNLRLILGVGLLGYFIWGIGPTETYRVLVATYERGVDEVAYLRSPPILHKKVGADPRVFLAFTFDDGHYSVSKWATPLLEAQGMRSTQFIITSTLSEDPWFYLPGSKFHMPSSEIKKLERRRHEMGSHTESHPDLMAEHDRRKVQHEIHGSRTRLAEVLNVPISKITSFAAPKGSYGPNEVVEIKKAGYTYAVTAWGLKPNLGKLNPYVIIRYNVGSEESSEDVCEFIDKAINSVHVANNPVLVALAFHYLEEGVEETPAAGAPAAYTIRVGTFKRIVECVSMRRDAGDLFVGTLTEAVQAYQAFENRFAEKQER